MQVRRFLQARRYLPFSCPEVGASRDYSPPGYPVNHRRGRLDLGDKTFTRAVEALTRWEMYRLGWTGLCWPEAPIAKGAVVDVLGRHFGGWSLNACSIYITAPARLRSNRAAT